MTLCFVLVLIPATVLASEKKAVPGTLIASAEGAEATTEKGSDMVSLEEALNSDIDFSTFTVKDYAFIIGALVLAFGAGFWAKNFIKKRAEQTRFDHRN